MNLETMSHDQAVSCHAAERYLLGELEPAERDAFEGHYFDCTACFDHIKKGSEFLSYTREVLDPEPEKGWLAGLVGDLRRPAPAFVSAALLCAIGIGSYQQVQIADARRPKVEIGFFVPAAQRGAEKLIKVPRNSQVNLSVPFTPSDEFASYQAKIVAKSGAVEYTLPVAAGQARDYAISLPAAKLHAGKYSLVIEGLSREGSARELSRGAFDLQFVD